MPYIRVTLNLDKDLWDRAKELALQRSTPVHEVSLSELVREALTLLLAGKEPVTKLKTTL